MVVVQLGTREKVNAFRAGLGDAAGVIALWAYVEKMGGEGQLTASFAGGPSYCEGWPHDPASWHWNTAAPIVDASSDRFRT